MRTTATTEIESCDCPDGELHSDECADRREEALRAAEYERDHGRHCTCGCNAND